MLSTESGFSEYVYFAAALDRVTEMNVLLRNSPPNYTLACYITGVAVECILHAYRMRSGVAKNDARHSIELLALRSKFYDGMTSKEKERIGGYVSDMVEGWDNDFRYRDETALKKFLVKKRLHFVRGDLLQNHAEKLVDAATQVVNSGEARWNNS